MYSSSCLRGVWLQFQALVHLDLRLQKLRECGAGSNLPAVLRIRFEQRKEQVARARRGRALQILKGSPLELTVLGVQGAEGNPHRVNRKQQRKESKEVLQVAI